MIELSGSIELTSYGYEAKLYIDAGNGETAAINAYHENPHQSAHIVRDALQGILDGAGARLMFYMDEPGIQPHEDYYVLYT